MRSPEIIAPQPSLKKGERFPALSDYEQVQSDQTQADGYYVGDAESRHDAASRAEVGR